jgi:hypothetical protein
MSAARPRGEGVVSQLTEMFVYVPSTIVTAMPRRHFEELIVHPAFTRCAPGAATTPRCSHDIGSFPHTCAPSHASTRRRRSSRLASATSSRNSNADMAHGDVAAGCVVIVLI